MEIIKRHRRVLIIMHAVYLFLIGYIGGELIRMIKPMINTSNPVINNKTLISAIALFVFAVLFIIFYNVKIKEPLRTRIDALECAYEDITLYNDVKESFVVDDPFSNMKPVAVYKKDSEGRIHFKWINF